MKPRRQWSDEEKLAIVRKYIAEGSPKKSTFAQENGVALSRLHAWLNTIREKPRTIPLPPPGTNVSHGTNDAARNDSAVITIVGSNLNRTPVLPDTKAEVAARLAANEDIEKIARDYGRKPSTIRSWAAEARRAKEHPPPGDTVSRNRNGLARMDAAIFANHAAQELDKRGVLPSQLHMSDLLWLLSRRQQIGDQ